MRLQSTQANCGAACLRNALLCHGIVRSEQEIETLAGTSADGTSAKGLLKALKVISVEHPSVTPGVLSESRRDVAILKCVAALQAGHVVIACVDTYDHWVVVFGLLGIGAKTVLHISDPADSELVQHMSPEAFLNRWKGPEKKPFYGIIV